MPKLLSALLMVFFLFNSAQAALPIPADKAFQFSAHMENAKTLVAEWQIEPGYYLYRDKLSIHPAAAADHQRLGQMEKSEAKKIYLSTRSELIHGSIWAYQGKLRIAVPLKGHSQEALKLIVKYQGCAQDGFCYAPETRTLELSFPFTKTGLDKTPLLMVSEGKGASVEGNILTNQEESQALFSGHSILVTLLSFLGLGILLAFTPCSLPMIPILSSIIVGQRDRGGKKAFILSLSYVMGVALTYALAGIAVAWLGSSIQSSLQNPWLLSAFALLFVALAFSLLGYFELRLPSAWQQKLGGWQGKQKGGSLLSVFLMGCFSTLLVSPCVTAPLVGVLAYVSESGNLLLGAAALFALGLGMGIPLLILGFSAGKYLPKAGPWMAFVNRFFAFLLLGLAVYMLSRFIPHGLSLFMYACLFMMASVSCFFSLDLLSKGGRTFGYGLSLSLLAYGFVLFMGVATGQDSPLYLFERMGQNAEALTFVQVKDMSELNHALQEAKAANKPALIDFYAEWCESCKAVEERVLKQATVQAALEHYVLIRANVSENNAFDQALFKRYNVIAPPTFLFINRQGQEEKAQRLVGEVGHQLFLAHAKAL